MRLTTLVVGAVAGVAGLAGATAGYQQLSASPRHVEQVRLSDTAGTTTPSAATPSAVTKVRLRGCPRGFELHHRVCVREVEHTVVIDVNPPAAAPARAVAPTSVPSPRASDDDPATHDARDDHGGSRHGASQGHGGRGDQADEQGDDHGDHGEDAEESDDHGDDHAEESEDHGDDDHAEVEDHGDETDD
jgi:hypothetical protein